MKYWLFIVFFTQLLWGNTSIAAEHGEIEFLLSYIADSDCIFIRNGDEHKAKGASKHLERKYNHVKSRINTAEDFINKIASRSSLSGRLYEVRCASVQLPTKQWLFEALKSRRLLQDKENKEGAE